MLHGDRRGSLGSARQLVRGALRHGQNAVLLVRRGAGDEIWTELRCRLSSSVEYVIHCRDLSVPYETPSARVPLHVRPMRPGDERALLDITAAHLSGSELRARLSRQRLLEYGIGSPYVAVTDDGHPVFVQWLFRAQDNDALAAYSHHFFPPLDTGQGILEGTFTVEPARGQGVMAWAQAEIAREAAAQGIRSVFTFTVTGNIASVKGTERAGFVPYGHQYERWRLFRRTVERTCPFPESRPLAHDRVG
jgi:hypothetical protein